MPTALYKEPWDVRRRLAELGLTSEDLVEIVKASFAGRGDCTDNDPPSAPGWNSWRLGTRRAREILRPKGWVKDETEQLSTVANKALKIKLAVCNTDDGTADTDRIPKNRSRKGAVSERATDRNASPFLYPEMEEDAKDDTSDYVTWYLCIYTTGDSARAELSCPSSFEAGYFTRYSERIFILAGDDWRQLDFFKADDDDLGPEIDVSVRLK